LKRDWDASLQPDEGRVLTPHSTFAGRGGAVVFLQCLVRMELLFSKNTCLSRLLFF
jgi:hypothetical protein